VVAKRCMAATALVERTIYDKFSALACIPPSFLRIRGRAGTRSGCFRKMLGEAYSPDAMEHRHSHGRWLGRMHTTAQSTTRRPLCQIRAWITIASTCDQPGVQSRKALPACLTARDRCATRRHCALPAGRVKLAPREALCHLFKALLSMVIFG
jgi:Ser/Thr protein kinase RdoA (MazF antagonist)